MPVKIKSNKLHSLCSALQADKRLTVWHFALLTSIFMIGLSQGKSSNVVVSRRRIMALAHITTLPTYHKYFKELQEMGYVVYRPSYHPGTKSEIDILGQSF